MTSDPFKLMPTDPDSFDGPPIDDEDLYCSCCDHWYTEEELNYYSPDDPWDDDDSPQTLEGAVDELYCLLTELYQDGDMLFNAMEHEDREQVADALWRIREALPYIKIGCEVGRDLALAPEVPE